MRNGSLSLFLALALACGREQSDTAHTATTATTSPQPAQVRVGIIPIAEVAPLYVGIEKGYFRDANLDLQLVRLAGGADILPQLATGSLDVGFTNVVSLVLFNLNRDSGYKALAGSSLEAAADVNHGLVSKGPLRPGRTLAGKTYGVNTRQNIEELMLLRFLRKHGVRADEVQLRPLPFPAMISAIQRDEIAVASLVEPFLTQAKTESLHVSPSQYLTEPSERTFVATYVVTDAWLEANDSKARAFVTAFSRAVAFINDAANRKETRAIIAKHTGISDQIAQSMGLPAFRECVDSVGLQMVADELATQKWIPTRVEASRFVAGRAAVCR